MSLILRSYPQWQTQKHFRLQHHLWEIRGLRGPSRKRWDCTGGNTEALLGSVWIEESASPSWQQPFPRQEDHRPEGEEGKGSQGRRGLGDGRMCLRDVAQQQGGGLWWIAPKGTRTLGPFIASPQCWPIYG